MSKWQEYKKNLGDTRPWDLITSEKVSDEVYEKRWGMCQACPELIGLTKQCKKCGCFMKLKTTLPAAECPIGKWGREDVSN